MTGTFPDADTDHVNINRADNRWRNLRSATRSQNRANTRKPVTNTSGLKGVSWVAPHNKWRARIKAGGTTAHLGLFRCPAMAAIVYECAAKIVFGEYARSI